jgi:hypothetical protein
MRIVGKLAVPSRHCLNAESQLFLATRPEQVILGRAHGNPAVRALRPAISRFP